MNKLQTSKTSETRVYERNKGILVKQGRTRQFAENL